MKAWHALIVALTSALPLAAQTLQSQFDAFAPAKASPEWQPNPSLWREITRGRSNAPVSIGEGGWRASGPLLDAYDTGRRVRGSRPNLGRTLLSIPAGIASLFVPQPMPKPPASGGRYFAWRGDNPAPWVHASAGVPVGVGSADNPVNHEPRNDLMTVGLRDEKKPELPLRGGAK